MSAASETLRRRLQSRAKYLATARTFLDRRGIVEVDCSMLGQGASIDLHIDLFSSSSSIHGRRFLFSSPEYQMKRLLASGSGDIYYLGHVFRHEACGEKHSPEFLMAEWYRVGLSFEQMIEETIAFTQLFLGPKEVYPLTYREAFHRYAKIDPFTCSHDEILNRCQPFSGYPIHEASRDDLLNLLMGLVIEPSFPKEKITVLYHYPASQAALASCHTTSEGHQVAERFELYSHGLELANGYHELTNPEEQHRRFVEENHRRLSLKKETYPIDWRFLEALKKGLPDCSGVAVGVDRLIMIAEQAASIHDVLPLPWSEL